MAPLPHAIPNPAQPAEPHHAPRRPGSPCAPALPNDLVPVLLSAFLDSSLSLHEIAASLKVGLNTLCLWLTSPQITEQVSHLNSINVWRTRSIATAALPAATKALRRISEEYVDEPPPSEPPASTQPRSQARPNPTEPYLRFLAISQRHRESARRASQLLSRLSRTPNIPGPVPPTAEAPQPPDLQSAHVPPARRSTSGERSVASVIDVDQPGPVSPVSPVPPTAATPQPSNAQPAHVPSPHTSTTGERSVSPAPSLPLGETALSEGSPPSPTRPTSPSSSPQSEIPDPQSLASTITDINSFAAEHRQEETVGSPSTHPP